MKEWVPLTTIKIVWGALKKGGSVKITTPGLDGGYPLCRPGMGYPHPDLGRSTPYPHLARGYPPPRPGKGVAPIQARSQDKGGTPN